MLTLKMSCHKSQTCQIWMLNHYCIRRLWLGLQFFVMDRWMNRPTDKWVLMSSCFHKSARKNKFCIWINYITDTVQFLICHFSYTNIYLVHSKTEVSGTQKLISKNIKLHADTYTAIPICYSKYLNRTKVFHLSCFYTNLNRTKVFHLSCSSSTTKPSIMSRCSSCRGDKSCGLNTLINLLIL